MAMRAVTFGLCLYLAIASVSAQDTGAKAAAEFKQCGGSTNCGGHPNCGDAPWSDIKCSTGYVCSRQNAFYWQCTNDPAALAAAGVAPAAGAVAPVLAGPAAPLPVAAPLAAPAEVFTTPRTGAQQPLPPILAETVITPNSVPAAAVPAQTAPSVVAPAADPMATTVATQIPSAPVVEPPAPPRPQYPGIKPAGPRNETAPATLACACIDIGLNDPACFKGVTDYCEAAEFKPNMTVCESMSSFFNNQNVTAARIVSDFLIDSCRVAVPPTATACACLEGPNSDGCKAATLNACHIGSPICAALAFGSEASDKSQESLQALIQQNCGPASSTSDIAMSFPGISKEEFNARYAKGTVAALAAVTKQPETAITMVALREVVSASSGKGGQTAGAAQAGAVPAGRKLLEASPKNLMIKYQIKCSPKDTMEVNKRLHAASANDGEGLYDALAAHGVPLRPSFSVNGGQMVSGSSSAHKKAHGLKGAAIAGVVIGVLAALALIGAGVAGVIMVLRKRGDDAGADGADAAEKGKSGGGAKVFDLTAESTVGTVSANDEKRAAKAAAEAERRAAKAAADAEKKAAKEAAEAEAAARKAAKEAAEAEKKAARQAEIAAKKAAAEAEAAAKRAAAAAEAEAAAKKAAEHAAARKEVEEAARKAAQELAAQKAAEAAAAKKAAEELASKKATEAAAAKKAADELAAKKAADGAAAKKAAEEAAAAAAKKAAEEAAAAAEAAVAAAAAAEAAAPEAAPAKPRRKAMFSLSPTGWTARE